MPATAFYIVQSKTAVTKFNFRASSTARCDTWLMLISKWRISTLSFPYLINNRPVTTATTYKYIGVHISANLLWVNPIKTTSAEASRTLGFLKRNVRTGSPHIQTVHNSPGPPPLNQNMATAARRRFLSRSKRRVNEAGPSHFYAE